jgi:hypothetical protein
MEVQDFVYLVAICFVLMLFMSSLSTGRRRRRRRRSSAFPPPTTTAIQETSAEVADEPTGDAVAAQSESAPENAEAAPSSAGDDGDTTIPTST